MNPVLTPQQQAQLLNPSQGIPGERQADDQPLPPPPGYEEETIAPLPKEQVHDQIHMDYTDSPVTPSFREALDTAPVNDAEAAADQLIQAAAETPTMADEVQDAIEQQETAAIMEQVAPQDPMTQSTDEGWHEVIMQAAQQALNAEEAPTMAEAMATEMEAQPEQPQVFTPIEEEVTPILEAPQPQPQEVPLPEQTLAPLPEPIPQPDQESEPEPAPVETVAPAPQPAPADYTVGVTDVSVRQLDDRVTINGKTMRVKRAVNRTLGYFIVDFLRNGVIDDTLKIQGSYLKGTTTEGIWEEGGASNVEGHVLLPVDPIGDPLCPAAVSLGKDEVNGTHALFQVWPGCFLILGGHSHGRNILAVYRIRESVRDKEKMAYPKYICDLVGTYINRRWKKDDKAPATFWCQDHPALTAAYNRIYQTWATTPCYAAAWRPHGFNLADFKNLLADEALIAAKKTYGSLEELYSVVNKVVGDKLAERISGKNACCITMLQYFPSKDVIGVFCFGVLYSFQERKSDGGRFFYGRAFLKNGDTFRYIERKPDTAIPFSDLKSQLNKVGRPMVSIVRRMTPAD